MLDQRVTVDYARAITRDHSTKGNDSVPVAREGLTGCEISSSMTPVGPGYMPLSCAIYWIVTEGRTLPFDQTTCLGWQTASRSICEYISEGRIEAIGIDNQGAPGVVPREYFSHCEIFTPFADDNELFKSITGAGIRLHTLLPVDESARRSEDTLSNGRFEEWVQLQIKRQDVRTVYNLKPDHIFETGPAGDTLDKVLECPDQNVKKILEATWDRKAAKSFCLQLTNDRKSSPPGRDEFAKLAIAEISGLGTNEARRLWEKHFRSLVNRRPGRPKKSPDNSPI